MITLKNIVLRRGSKVLLDQASVSINPGEKVGLVGRNGAGKSTLFGLLNGSLHEDGGDFSYPPSWRLAQVEQNMPETEQGAADFVLSGDTRLQELHLRLQAAQASGDGMAMAHAYSDLADAGEHDALPRAQALILGLGFKVDELDQPVNRFSGGWRMRLQLARSLMCPSDLLLLDEPTNHLDLDALVWLESWLQRYNGTLLVISHDREFLDAVTRTTVHIDHARLTRYGGNYSAFEEQRSQQLLLQQAAFAKQQDRIAHLQQFINRFKAKASKAKQAQSRVKALERMERVAPLLSDAEFTFEFKAPGQLPNPMLALSDTVLGYQVEGRAQVIVRGVNRSVMAGQRIGILGANGQGKSTLVKTIAGQIAPLSGQVIAGRGLRIGYFAQQELDVLRAQDTPLEHMIRLAREADTGQREAGREQDLRGFLGSFNFSGDMVQQTVGSMSGGEKARLVLAMMVWQRPNLLLLDEPTNHLDLNTREALSVALNEFEGTVLLVSHDRALLRAVCDEFWLVGGGGLSDFDGDLDDYQRYLLEESRRLREQDRQASRDASAAAPPAVAAAAPLGTPQVTASSANPREHRRLQAQQRQQWAEQTRLAKRELAQVEKTMAQQQARLQALETVCADLQTDAAARIQAGKQLKALHADIATLEDQWLALSQQLEGVPQ